MLTRRGFGLGATALAGAFAWVSPSAAEGAWPEDFRRACREIEGKSRGRLGAAVLDTETGRSADHRGDELFPMCSTFKTLAAAAVLAKIDHGEDRLDRRVAYAKADLVPYSPETGKHADGGGMTLAAICEAAVTLSDNTAGNLMLGVIGGPAGLTAWLRGLGDSVTRLDRTEPTLNESLPGDPRDTTSPRAMAATLNRLVLGDALAPASRAQLTEWLLGCKTGDARIRAGVPKDWRVGDKTGTGERGSANDAGVIWPPGRKPLILTVYLAAPEGTPDERSARIAEVARAMHAAVAE